MFDQIEILRMAGALASHAAQRQDAIARNVANADTPGYKAVDVPDFATTWAEGSDFTPRANLPGHFQTSAEPTGAERLAPRQKPGSESPNGNTVSLETEMVDAAEVRQQHDMALAVYRSTTTMLRVALGVAK